MELPALTTTSPAATTVLAHGSDPIAIIGFFGPALLLLLLVIGAVIWDRRRRGGEREAQRSAHRAEAGDEALRPRVGGAIPPRAD